MKTLGSTAKTRHGQINNQGETHALYSQVPSRGQVLDGAQAGNFEEQLHRVDCAQKEAMSRGPGAASPTPGLAPFLRTLLGSDHVRCGHPRPTCAPSESVGSGAGPGPDAGQPGLPTNKTSTQSRCLGGARPCTGCLEFRGRRGTRMLHWGRYYI